MVFSDTDEEGMGRGPTPTSASNATNSLPDSESLSSRNGSSLSTPSTETTTSKSQGGKRHPSENLQNQSKKPTAKKEGDFTSDVWEYFRREIVIGKEEDGLRAVCNFCSSNYLISGTGNMRNHLKSKHPEKLPESMLNDKNEKMQQSTLDKNLTVTKPYKVCKIYYHILRFSR